MINSGTLPISILSPQQESMNVLISSLLDFINHQQALQKDATAVMSILSELYSQYKNDHFLANLKNVMKRVINHL